MQDASLGLILALTFGRALPTKKVVFSLKTFVSILARPEGRALRRNKQGEGEDDEVSILARPEGRALHLIHPLLNPINSCFNPRPPRRTGATEEVDVVKWEEVVSILARPEGRALRASPVMAPVQT